MKFGRQLWILIIVLLLWVLLPGAFAEGEDPLRYVHLSEAVFSFDFVPTANGEYSVCIFSVDGNTVSAEVSVTENETLIMEGEGRGTVCTARLAAGVKYSVSATGSGYAALEVSRKALSRCYDDALPIEENKTKSKMIARPGDAHWYRFTAGGDSFVLLACVPEDPYIDLGAFLMDDSGNLIAEFDPVSGGACLLRAETEAGREYYVRLHSPEGSVGYYGFTVHRSEGLLPVQIPSFNADVYTISRNHTLDLKECTLGTTYLFTVDRPDICTITEEGIAVGLSEGTAVITAHGFSSQAYCKIRVVDVPIETIDILTDKITLHVGDDADVPINVLPENASSGLLIFTIEDSDVASVAGTGVVTGLSPGKTVLHAATLDGRVSDTAEIIVEEAPPRYRALLVGEENYPDSINESRPGTQLALRAMSNALSTMDMNGERYLTSVYADVSRSEFIAAIRETFARAGEKDISLIYISCHGEYDLGTCCLQFTDGSLYSMRMLEKELRGIRGRVVLVLDCCASGGAIGISSESKLFAHHTVDRYGLDVFPISKYNVICSTVADRDSYRVAIGNADAPMLTAFSRAFCDAIGWDIDTDQKTGMRADTDFDGNLTFDELYTYLSERVDTYMSKVSEDTGMVYLQEVVTNTPGDPLCLFA